MSTKLYRNLKKGDKIVLLDETDYPKIRKHILIVSSVRECSRAWFTGKRQWEVSGNYPFWFPFPIRAYSNDRTELYAG